MYIRTHPLSRVEDQVWASFRVLSINVVVFICIICCPCLFVGLALLQLLLVHTGHTLFTATGSSAWRVLSKKQSGYTTAIHIYIHRFNKTIVLVYKDDTVWNVCVVYYNSKSYVHWLLLPKNIVNKTDDIHKKNSIFIYFYQQRFGPNLFGPP